MTMTANSTTPANPPPALQGLDPQGRTIYVGTFTKSMFLGYAHRLYGVAGFAGRPNRWRRTLLGWTQRSDPAADAGAVSWRAPGAQCAYHAVLSPKRRDVLARLVPPNIWATSRAAGAGGRHVIPCTCCTALLERRRRGWCAQGGHRPARLGLAACIEARNRRSFLIGCRSRARLGVAASWRRLTSATPLTSDRRASAKQPGLNRQAHLQRRQQLLPATGLGGGSADRGDTQSRGRATRHGGEANRGRLTSFAMACAASMRPSAVVVAAESALCASARRCPVSRPAPALQQGWRQTRARSWAMLSLGSCSAQKHPLLLNQLQDWFAMRAPASQGGSSCKGSWRVFCSSHLISSSCPCHKAAPETGQPGLGSAVAM